MAVLTVIEDEFDAALQAVGATHEIGMTGRFAPVVTRRRSDGNRP